MPKGGGDVAITPQSNSQTLQTFQAGQIDGAWVPEPWATQMINAGGHVLVDERTLWPEGKYVTTHLIVNTTFLQAHPDVIKNLIKGEMATTDYVNSNASAAQSTVSNEITRITGSSMSARRAGDGLGKPDVHHGSDRFVAPEVGRRRQRVGSSIVRPQGHLRLDACSTRSCRRQAR